MFETYFTQMNSPTVLQADRGVSRFDLALASLLC